MKINESEILRYYDENWNDYSKIVDMLHDIIDKHEEEIMKLKKELDKNSEVEELKQLLQECQDALDEERHKIMQ